MMKETIKRSIEEKFQKDTLPILRENARWRARSRQTNFSTCLPGDCPQVGDWPKPKIKPISDLALFNFQVLTIF